VVVDDDMSREVVDEDTFVVRVAPVAVAAAVVVRDRAGIPIAKEFVDGATNDTMDRI